MTSKYRRYHSEEHRPRLSCSLIRTVLMHFDIRKVNQAMKVVNKFNIKIADYI